MNFTTRVLGTFGTHISTFIFSILASIFIARSLGPEGKGILALVMLIQTLLVLVSNLGLSVSNNYYSASKKYELSALVSNSFVIAGAIGMFVLAAFISFWHFSPFDLFHEVPSLYIYVILTIFPLSLFNSFLRGILLGKLKIRQLNVVDILLALIYFPGVVVILYVFKQGILSLILLYIAIQIITSFSYIIIVRRLTKYKFRFYLKVFKGTVGYGIKAHIANISTFLHYRADQFMIGYFLGITELGYYAIAVPIVELLLFIPRSISDILFPEVASSTPERAAELTARICRYTVLISLMLCLVFAIGANVLIKIVFGEQFQPAVTPLLILLPGMFLRSIAQSIGSYIIGRGRVIFNTYGALVAMPMNIGLNLVLIPRMGIAGAALATTITYSLSLIYATIVFKVLSKKSLYDTFIPKQQELVDLLKLLMRYFGIGYSFVKKKLRNNSR